MSKPKQWENRIVRGDTLETLKLMPSEIISCIMSIKKCKKSLTNTSTYGILNLSIGKADFLCLISPLVCEEGLTVNPIDRRTGAFC